MNASFNTVKWQNNFFWERVRNQDFKQKTLIPCIHLLNTLISKMKQSRYPKKKKKKKRKQFYRRGSASDFEIVL